MKITREDLKTKFVNLRIGAVFEYNGWIYMKARFNSRDTKLVRLDDGIIFDLVDDAPALKVATVIPLDAELIVRGVLNEDADR